MWMLNSSFRVRWFVNPFTIKLPIKWMLLVALVLLSQSLSGRTCPHPCQCQHETYNNDFLMTAECSKKSLTVTPMGFNDSTKILRTNFNNISSLKREELMKAGLRKLRVLMMLGNSLKIVEPGAFLGMDMLEDLDLEGNQITLTAGMFKGLRNLRYLNLRNNNISVVEAGVFQDMRLLEELALDVNSIHTITPGAFLQLAELKILNMRRNNITVLASNVLMGIEYLKSLILGENCITTIQQDTFSKFPLLQELHLDGNSIQLVSAGAFDGLESLTHLHLDRNNLSRLETDMFRDLNSLTTLTMWKNELTVLERDVWGDAEMVKNLNLRKNRIEIWKAPSLWKLRQIRNLDLAMNNIKSVPWNALSNLTRLENLDLSYNQIRWLDPDTFLWSSRLQYLHLSGNKLLSLGPHLLRPLRKLEKLWLSENHISFIHPEAFQNQMSRHLEIYLDGNRLQTIDADVFKSIKYVPKLVALNNNSLQCDCKLKEVQQLFAKLYSTAVLIALRSADSTVPEPECATPPHLAGQKWSIVTSINCTVKNENYGTNLQEVIHYLDKVAKELEVVGKNTLKMSKDILGFVNRFKPLS